LFVCGTRENPGETRPHIQIRKVMQIRQQYINCYGNYNIHLHVYVIVSINAAKKEDTPAEILLVGHATEV
jgi:hypothetical protein